MTFHKRPARKDSAEALDLSYPKQPLLFRENGKETTNILRLDERHTRIVIKF
jgi:membrane-anchored protein YejM (alkaline phosphatase superfamily)